MSDARLVSKPERGERGLDIMRRADSETLEKIKAAVDFAIAKESKGLKPDEIVDVSIDLSRKGIVVMARKVKKDGKSD